MLCDTHCHLNFKAFKKDLNEVITKAKEANVSKIIVPGASINSSERAVEISRTYDGIYAAVGVHPHHASKEFEIDKLKKLAKYKKTAAIGEIGLDHHRYKNFPPLSEEDMRRQVDIFWQQLKTALEFNLPVIIHCREAQDLLLKVITDFMNKKGKLQGVFHCFEGNEDYLKRLVDLGFYVGFDGNVTYPENKEITRIIKKVPLDRLVLETDAPFLTPQKFRSKRNEPSYLTETAMFIASLLKIGIEKISEITTRNAEGLFVLK